MCSPDEPTWSFDHSWTGPFCQWCDAFRSLEKLVLEPDRSSTWLGEYPGDVEPLDMLDGDGGPCCCHGTVPGGESDCGITFLTRSTKCILYLLIMPFANVFKRGTNLLAVLRWLPVEFRPVVFVTLWLDLANDSVLKNHRWNLSMIHLPIGGCIQKNWRKFVFVVCLY